MSVRLAHLLTAIAATALWSKSAIAGSTYTGVIGSVVCHATGVSSLCQVSVPGSVGGETCSQGSLWKYTFNGATAEGKNLLAIMLAAQVSRQTVEIGVLGTCSLAAGSEDIRHTYIVSP